MQVVRIVTGRGAVLTASMQGNLKHLLDDGAGLVRENGVRLEGVTRGAGTRALVSCDTTWLAHDTDVLRFEHGVLAGRLSTATFQGEPAFAANARDAFALQGDWLQSATSGRRIGQVIAGQTWFRVGDDVGFGFYRSGMLTRYFTFAPARGGLRAVSLPDLRGRVVDAEAYFDAGHALFVVTTEEHGQVTTAMHLVRADGAVLASMRGAPGDHVALGTVFGKCVAFGVVLVAHDDGLLAMKADPSTGRFVEARAFAGARDAVSADSDLMPGPGGSLYVAGPRDILQLAIV
jgi:hypothetical protein